MPRKQQNKMRPEGRYEAKGVDPATGKRKSYYSRVSQEDANRLAKASYGVQNDGSFYWYFATAYVPSVSARSQNWKTQISWAMDGWWLPKFGHLKIDEITRSDVQKHMNHLSTKLSPKSVSHVYKVVSAIFALAEVDEIIPRTPCLKIRLPRIPEPDKTALTFGQLWRLYTGCHDLIRPFVLLAGFCGGHREGEACGQSWHCLNKEGVLEIRQQVRQLPKKAELTPELKTPQSNRLVPLPPDLIEALKGCNQVSDVYICSDTVGGYLLPKNIDRELRIACRKVGLLKRDKNGDAILAPDEKPRGLITPNELRHTFISLMENELEAPRRVVERLVGKAKSGKTAPYSHTEIRQLRKWMQKFWDEAKRQGELELRLQQVSSS